MTGTYTANIASEYVHVNFLRNTADITSNDVELATFTGTVESNTANIVSGYSNTVGTVKTKDVSVNVISVL